ncbi:hypothetical protein GCM10009775_19710 [Microbacterium aoyamense]|uniref:Uncharacterized protein n=1 Tax=Microbacterium aoyamense TaxID=344166 RepID=A0ABN2PSH6_9MICO|nr:hypothetical protein [Microbacterium aoyamense]
MTDAPSAAALRRTLTVGGVLLIAGAVLTFAQPTFFSLSIPLAEVMSWLAVGAYSATLLVFAFGLGRSGSIVSRRPLAVTAAVIVAAWPLVQRMVSWLVPVESALDFYRAWGYISWTVTLAATIVFVVQIARAGVLRGRVRWMPLWGLVIVVVPQILTQAVIVAAGIDFSTRADEWIFLFFGLERLCAFAVPVALGIIALVIANRAAPVSDPVQVYPPST